MNEAQPKILYIEDNPDNQRLVQRVLGARGYEVVLAGDGTEGLTIARELTPQLVLVDLNIPGLDGFEVTTRLSSLSHLQQVPIVALTADNSPDARERALVAGCDGFLLKPIDPRLLARQIGEYIAGHREQIASPTAEAALLRSYNQRLVERLEQQVRELSSANAELEELDRLKSQFLATLSHELRTPLTSLIGYLELFERGILGTLNEAQHEALKVMHRNSETLALQLNNLLYFQELRSRSIVPQAIQPTELLRPLLATYHQVAQTAGLHFEAAGTQTAPLAVDRSAFEQLVRVLLDNAFKFTPRGGRVRMIIRDEPSRLIMRVEDSGVGIAPEHQQKIFLPFYRVEAPHASLHPGAGLGLAIAKHIAEVHRGQLTVQSIVGRGSVFSVVLPRTGSHGS